jgi:cytochrome b6-f complex iron-sulfur subunit
VSGAARGPASEACAGCEALSRRTFLAQATLVAAAGLLAACNVGNATSPSFHAFSIHPADFPALGAVGGIAVVDDGSSSGVPMAVVRAGDVTYLALSLVCPHRGGTVGISGSGFLCPVHGARFSSTGAWAGGQPTGNLSSYPAQYDPGTGTLAIG